MQGVLFVVAWVLFMLSLGALGNESYLAFMLLLGSAWGLASWGVRLHEAKRKS